MAKVFTELIDLWERVQVICPCLTIGIKRCGLRVVGVGFWLKVRARLFILIVSRFMRDKSSIIKTLLRVWSIGKIKPMGFKCLHTIWQKKKGRVSWVALKIDTSDAYKQVKWIFFLKKFLSKIGFHHKFVKTSLNVFPQSQALQPFMCWKMFFWRFSVYLSTILFVRRSPISCSGRGFGLIQTIMI